MVIEDIHLKTKQSIKNTASTEAQSAHLPLHSTQDLLQELRFVTDAVLLTLERVELVLQLRLQLLHHPIVHSSHLELSVFFCELYCLNVLLYVSLYTWCFKTLRAVGTK